MKIVVTPDDLIKRCVWDSFTHYILDVSKEEEDRIISENQEFEIDERDALVIGLVKVIETPNLAYKFNVYVKECLNNNSILSGKNILCKKKVIDALPEKFLNKFPDAWQADDRYKSGLIELVNFMEEFKSSLEEQELFKYTDIYGTYICYKTSKVKKLLKFHF